MERCDEVVEHHPDACRRCGTLLRGEDPGPLRHQVIEIPPITPLVIEHRLHRLVCPCCSTSTLRQQGRHIWQFLEQAWVAHHRGSVMPSLLPDY